MRFPRDYSLPFGWMVWALDLHPKAKKGWQTIPCIKAFRVDLQPVACKWRGVIYNASPIQGYFIGRKISVPVNRTITLLSASTTLTIPISRSDRILYNNWGMSGTHSESIIQTAAFLCASDVLGRRRSRKRHFWFDEGRWSGVSWLLLIRITLWIDVDF